MSGRIGRIDGLAGLAVAALAFPVLEVVIARDPYDRRRHRNAYLDLPKRETSRAPAPLPGDLKRWAPPVVSEMPRQQRRALMRAMPVHSPASFINYLGSPT